MDKVPEGRDHDEHWISKATQELDMMISIGSMENGLESGGAEIAAWWKSPSKR